MVGMKGTAAVLTPNHTNSKRLRQKFSVRVVIAHRLSVRYSTHMAAQTILQRGSAARLQLKWVKSAQSLELPDPPQAQAL